MIEEWKGKQKMRLVSRGTVFQSEEGTDRQSCAFPQVAILPDGRWLASCRAAFTKGGKEGQHVLLSFSNDEGKTWSAQLSPFAAPEINGKPGQFRVCALTPLGGANVLAALYWVDNSAPSLPFFNEKTEGLLDSRIMFSRSGDCGLTWTEPVLMDSSPFNIPTPITGPVLLLPDGELVCQFETNKEYYDTSKWVHSSVLMFSKDGGRSWPAHTVVTRNPNIFHWDQRCQVMSDGRLFNVFWTYDNKAAKYLNIHACESKDSGRTWSPLWDTGVPGQPAQVIQLCDGALVMAYVDRTGATAIRSRVSFDGGHSWPEESTLTFYDSESPSQTVSKDNMVDTWSEMGKFSAGLPSTAVLENGDVMVVYYAGRNTDATRVEWVRIRAG